MKKLFLMLALFSAVVSGANAQIATENSNAFDNIGFGVTVGATSPLDFNSMFPVNVNLGLKLTKDITPSFGFQLEGIAFLNDNHFSDIKTTVKATNVGLNGALNLSNAIWGYKGTPRVFEVSAIAGLGWLHSWDASDNNIACKTGFDIAFNLGKNKAHSLVLTPAIYWNIHKFKHIYFSKHEAQIALNLSYIYHFKTSNGTHHFKTYDVGAMMDEINRLNGALEECHSQQPKVVEKIIKETVTVTVNNEKWIVPFEFGKSTLTNEAIFILNQIGNDAIVDVIATASPEGGKEYNQKLSEMRAARVKDYLEKRGVKVKSAVGKGVDAVNGRTAIVTVPKD